MSGVGWTPLSCDLSAQFAVIKVSSEVSRQRLYDTAHRTDADLRIPARTVRAPTPGGGWGTVGRTGLPPRQPGREGLLVELTLPRHRGSDAEAPQACQYAASDTVAPSGAFFSASS